MKIAWGEGKGLHASPHSSSPATTSLASIQGPTSGPTTPETKPVAVPRGILKKPSTDSLHKRVKLLLPEKSLSIHSKYSSGQRVVRPGHGSDFGSLSSSDFVFPAPQPSNLLKPFSPDTATVQLSNLQSAARPLSFAETPTRFGQSAQSAALHRSHPDLAEPLFPYKPIATALPDGQKTFYLGPPPDVIFRAPTHPDGRTSVHPAIHPAHQSAGDIPRDERSKSTKQPRRSKRSKRQLKRHSDSPSQSDRNRSVPFESLSTAGALVRNYRRGSSGTVEFAGEKRNTNQRLSFESEENMPVHPRPVSICLYVLLAVTTIAALTVFMYHEWSAARVRRRLHPLLKYYTPVSCQPNAKFNGKLIHLDCPLSNLHTFNPPTEFSWNVAPFRGVFFDVVVQMYQWDASSGLFGVRLGGVWSDAPIKMATLPSFVHATRENPPYFPHINGVGRHFAQEVHAGGFRLTSGDISKFRERRPLPVKPDGYYSAADERPPSYADYSNTHAYNDALWTGDPLNPKIGDLKITFWGSTATHVSALAVQEQVPGFVQSFKLKPFNNPEFSNNTVSILSEGDFSPEELVSRSVSKEDEPLWFMILVRSGTAVALTLFAFYTHRMSSPDRGVGPCAEFAGAISVSAGILCVSAGGVWMLASLVTGSLLTGAGFMSFVSGIALWSERQKKDRLSRTGAELTPMIFDPNRPRSASIDTHSNLSCRDDRMWPDRPTGRPYYQPV